MLGGVLTHAGIELILCGHSLGSGVAALLAMVGLNQAQLSNFVLVDGTIGC